MLFKVQKRILGIECVVDFCEYENNILRVKGWLFSYKHQVSGVKILIKAKNQQYLIDIATGIKRSDVYREIPVENAKKSGFFGKIMIENLKEFEVWLVFEVNGTKCEYKLQDFVSDKKVKENILVKVEGLSIKSKETDFTVLLKNEKRAWEFKEEYYSENVDIILPIYNGYHFFERLFSTIELTKMKYRLIILNDCSTDERVSPFLHQYADGKENVILIEHNRNQGFVKNVNKGLELSKGHVVLVNSDVELPEMWLERLLLPILQDDTIASSTPYTNCGIITSFPEIGQDNELFAHLSLKEIDEEFQKISPRYLEMPTGVGFCMAMNKKAIADVGLLDADSFGMGYGEENDWCQRAINKGYRNVHVENLFVYHKHGGSFLSEDKKRYMEEHAAILKKKHPDYDSQVSKFFAIDENRDIRRLVKYMLRIKSRPKKVIAALDHDLGGGATSYLVGKKNHWVDNGCAFCIIRYNYVQNYYPIQFYYGEEKYEFFVKEQTDICNAMKYMGVNEIWINELVTYPRLYKLMREIKEYSIQNHAVLKMLLHDYFAVCPTINLLNGEERYCGLPEGGECGSCFEKCNPIFKEEYNSIQTWRNEWYDFLKACDSVIVFSKDSQRILERVYGNLENVQLIPHQIGYMPKIEKKYKLSNSFTIGLLGVLTKHKGAEIVKELVSEIEREGLNIKVKLIGTLSETIDSPIFSETGKYTRDGIPYLTLKQDIDLFLIPSVWPETFSYTTEEIMKMGMPIMCFNIGAPAERVSRYEKGIVVSEMSAQAILDEVKTRNMIQNCLKLERKNKQVLFVTEENTFATRYRVDHLREQLLLQGVVSRRIMIGQASKCDLKEYNSIVIYRGSRTALIQKLVKRAHKFGKMVYYDMDDFIFEYDKIKHLKFLQGKDYKDFKNYSSNIKRSMNLCDGYIVSTEALKKVTRGSFPGKPVLINRNVASMAMFICSLDNQRTEYDNQKIYLGYFSGTKTHNEDFESIKDAILDVMKANENVYLLIGGQIQLPEEFNAVKSRIERFRFVLWRALPRLIAKVDINLMPLEKTEFHDCKSENKWMEAALVRVPTVATRNSELERVITDGVDGYLCKDIDEWKEALQRMICDGELRRQIADAAYEKAEGYYTTAGVEPEVVEALTR